MRWNFPSLAHLAATQLGCVVAGELGGAREDSGGTATQLTNLAHVALIAFADSRAAAAAKSRDARNAEWLQLAIDRRDPAKVETAVDGTISASNYARAGHAEDSV